MYSSQIISRKLAFGNIIFAILMQLDMIIVTTVFKVISDSPKFTKKFSSKQQNVFNVKRSGNSRMQGQLMAVSKASDPGSV